MGFEIAISVRNLLRFAALNALLAGSLALRRGWNVRHVQQQKVVAAFVSCEPEAVAAELRQLCLDLPVIDFHRSERRLEEAFVDILIHGSGEPAPRQNPASSQESPSIPAS